MIRNRFIRLAPSLAIRYRRIVRYSFEPELPFVANYLRSHTGVFVDIGAHLGTWSFWIASRDQRVFAIEPNPVLANILRRSRIPKATIEECALGAIEGSVVLQVPFRDGLPRPGNGTVTGFRIAPDESVLALTVRQRRLDDLIVDAVAAVKIDCEGGEEGVIKGALGTIRRDRPLVVVEIHHERADELRRISRLLSPFGYKPYWLDGTQLVDCSTRPRPVPCDNVVFMSGLAGTDLVP